MEILSGLPKILAVFLILAVILPIFTTFLFLFAVALAGLGDEVGKIVLIRAAILCCALWGTDLAFLLITLAAERLERP